MHAKSNMDRVKRITSIIDRLDDRGVELMQRAFNEQSRRSIDHCLRSLKILSSRAIRLQAIVDSMPRRPMFASYEGVVPSVN